MTEFLILFTSRKNILFLAWINMYFECRKSISENGVFDAKTGRKNGLLPVIRDIQATISKQIMHLGISPYTASKVRSGEEDDSNLLSNLMGLND